MNAEDKMINLFNKQIENCKCDERTGMKQHLLNDIGVLRGIAYCLETIGVCPHGSDNLLHFIDIQNEMTQFEWDDYLERRKQEYITSKEEVQNNDTK